MTASLENESISQWLTESGVAAPLMERMPGDASTRSYYRVRSEEKRFVLMRTDPFVGRADFLPFLAVQRHLSEAGVDVPRVFGCHPGMGLILLEDLGDITLLRRLQGVSSSDVERHLYEKVIDCLVHLQVHASPSAKPSGIEAYRLRFDHEKLMWEVKFTFEHFYHKYLGRLISAEAMDGLSRGFSQICTLLAEQPTVLSHRDFHSRNIMVLGEGSFNSCRIVMVDFQDARLGPPHYDLASLLKDSYYQLEEAQVDRLVDYYVARWEALSGDSVDREHFRKIFDLMSVQRNFKAIGSFSSFLNQRGNPTYLKFIGNTFENIRKTLLRYPEYAQLRELLFHYYYF